MAEVVVPRDAVGKVGGPAGPLDSSGKVPPSQLPTPAPAGVSSVNTRSGAVTLTKTDVGLANVDNTSDAAKPLSTAATNALALKADTTALATKADLVGGKVPASQLPASGSVATADLKYALGRWRASLVNRNAARILHFFFGSSTTAGTGASSAATRYVNVFNDFLVKAYPRSDNSVAAPVRTLSEAESASLANGVQTINGGISGSESGTGNDGSGTPSLTTAMITRTAALASGAGCSFLGLMTGSNDWSHAVTPAQYKTNLKDLIDFAVTAYDTKPFVFVLLDTYARADSTAQQTPVAPWSEYGAKMRELATEYPDVVAYVDTSKGYLQSKIPGADPFGFMTNDLIHGNDKSHVFIADNLRRELEVPLVSAGGSVTPNDPTAVQNTTPPTVDGGSAVGDQQLATTGVWTNSPTGFLYQWNRNGQAISGANSAAYTPVAADGDTNLTVTVTATRTNYTSGTASSTPKTIGAPLGGTIVTSDSFGGAAGTLSGTSSDAALGGNVLSYGTIPGTLFRRDGSGNLTIDPAGSPTPGHAAFDIGSANQHHILETTSIASGSFWIDLRKTSSVVSSNTVRLQLAPAASTAYLVSRVGGSTTIGQAIAVDLSVPHIFMVSISGTTIKWWLDGTLQDTLSNYTTITTGTVGALTTTSACSAIIRSWTIRAL